MSIHEELAVIQKKLIAPKNQYNSFGKYPYRNTEDILEAIKKITKCAVVLSDEIVMLGDRFYIKATASLINGGGEKVESTAYARESQSRKGMNDDQLTGSTSSYARKYALNGLFSIDDSKDSDTIEDRKENSKTEKDRKQDSTVNEMLKLIDANDVAFTQVWHELDRDEQGKYWKLINSKQQDVARELIKQAKEVA